MTKALVPMVLALALTLALGCGADDSSTATDDAISDHMVAEATLTAHYVAAALEAGMTQDEINAVLKQIAGDTVISESQFCIRRISPAAKGQRSFHTSVSPVSPFSVGVASTL